MATIARYVVALLVVGGSMALQAQEQKFDPERTAQELLNDASDSARRDLLVKESVPHAADVIRAMTKDLPADEEEEYRRIPWIWQVAIAAGRENDDKVLQALLDASMPADDQKPLEDWQSVVIGGGIINGVSQAGDWPAERINELLGDDEGRQARWKHTIQAAVSMADDEATRTGTRYDALRILGAGDWETHREQIVKYLAADANHELQMGAVSAAGDVADARATEVLIDHLEGLAEGNRAIAIEALMRTPQRRDALRAAIQGGKAQEAWLSPEQKEALNSR